MRLEDEVFLGDLHEVEKQLISDAAEKGYDHTNTATWMLLQAILRNQEARVLSVIDRPKRSLRLGVIDDPHGQATDSSQAR